jgi:hypothetical protein
MSLHGIQVSVALTSIDMRWSFNRLSGFALRRVGPDAPDTFTEIFGMAVRGEGATPTYMNLSSRPQPVRVGISTYLRRVTALLTPLLAALAISGCASDSGDLETGLDDSEHELVSGSAVIQRRLCTIDDASGPRLTVRCKTPFSSVSPVASCTRGGVGRCQALVWKGSDTPGAGPSVPSVARLRGASASRERVCLQTVGLYERPGLTHILPLADCAGVAALCPELNEAACQANPQCLPTPFRTTCRADGGCFLDTFRRGCEFNTTSPATQTR